MAMHKELSLTVPKSTDQFQNGNRAVFKQRKNNINKCVSHIHTRNQPTITGIIETYNVLIRQHLNHLDYHTIISYADANINDIARFAHSFVRLLCADITADCTTPTHPPDKYNTQKMKQKREINKKNNHIII